MLSWPEKGEASACAALALLQEASLLLRLREAVKKLFQEQVKREAKVTKKISL